MPRTARIALPNYPHHVIPRGHNRQAAFADPDDYRYCLANLAIWKTAYECKVYAYCLMTNHVHLIIDPGDTPEHLGMLTKRVAGRQTRYVNRLEGRSGTLWEHIPIDACRLLVYPFRQHQQHTSGGANMEQSHLEVLLEDIRSKFELVLEGHSVLNDKIDAFRAESNEKHEQTAFLLKAMSGKIDAVREESNEKHDQTAVLLKAVAADLSAHRADTEAHPLYQVREPSP